MPERVAPDGGTIIELTQTSEAQVPAPSTPSKVHLFVDPDKGLRLKGFGGVNPDAWEVAYFRRVKDSDSHDQGEQDAGVDVGPAYEYAVGSFTRAKHNPDANYDDPETIQILRILSGLSVAFTPTVGTGAGKTDGIPHRVSAEGTEVKYTEGDNEPYREIAFIGAGSIGSNGPPSPDEIYVAYTASVGSYVALNEARFWVYFGQEGNIDGLDLFQFIMRRRVA